MTQGFDLKNNKRIGLSVLVVLVFAGILISLVPVLCGGDILIPYQDKLFHLRRIAALADTLANGYFPARIYFVMNSGTGYAMPVFYPDIFMYFPALLYLAGLSLTAAYNAYIVSVQIATALVCYLSVKAMTGGNRIAAAVISFVYELSAYRLTCVYIRDAVGEYTAMAFLPFVAYAFFRVYRKGILQEGRAGEISSKKAAYMDALKDAILLGLSMSLVAMSHVLTTMICIMMLVLCAAVLFRYTFKKYIFARLLISAIVFVLIMASFFVPMIDYMSADRFRFGESTSYMRGFYPGFKEIFEIIPWGTGSGIEYEMRMPTMVGITMTVILAIWILRSVVVIYAYLKKNKKPGRWFAAESIAGSFAILSLFVSSKFFPWVYLSGGKGIISKLLCSVQFSWRYLGFASLFIVVLGGWLLDDIMHESIRNFGICIVLMMILSAVTGLTFCISAVRDNEHVKISSGESIGIIGDELYYPISWNGLPGSPGEAVVSDGVTIRDFSLHSYRWDIDVRVDESAQLGCIVFPIVYYKGYRAYCDAKGKLEVMQATDGRVMVNLSSGYDGRLSLEYEEPFYWRISEIISLLFAAAAVIFLTRRRKSS